MTDAMTSLNSKRWNFQNDGVLVVLHLQLIASVYITNCDSRLGINRKFIERYHCLGTCSTCYSIDQRSMIRCNCTEFTQWNEHCVRMRKFIHTGLPDSRTPGDEPHTTSNTALLAYCDLIRVV